MYKKNLPCYLVDNNRQDNGLFNFFSPNISPTTFNRFDINSTVKEIQLLNLENVRLINSYSVLSLSTFFFKFWCLKWHLGEFGLTWWLQKVAATFHLNLTLLSNNIKAVVSTSQICIPYSFLHYLQSLIILFINYEQRQEYLVE